MSLTKADLKAIENVVDVVITKRIEPRFDDLELRIGAGFNETYEHFEHLDQRFEAIESHLDILKLTTSHVKGNIAGLHNRLLRIESILYPGKTAGKTIESY